MRHGFRSISPNGKNKGAPPKLKPRESLAVIKRLLSYVTGGHKAYLIFVFFCVTVSAAVGAVSSVFIRALIDDYIPPLLAGGSPNDLIRTLTVMGVIFLCGTLATLFSGRFMAVIAQSVLKTIRDDMFTHMQSLPVSYFDRNTHGDIMSRYTNDADALRQMISMSIPQFVSSVLTMTVVFFMMVFLSIPLTVTVLVFVGIMLLTARFISKKSGKFFFRQQESIGAVNGYIEEMINGQRVVKVFCREEAAKAKFDTLNSRLFTDAANANGYANIIMPVIMNIGYMQYVAVAVIGGLLAINGAAGITLGTIAAFLTLSRTFSFPIGQISQQFNAIFMALAGASRIFNLLDEQPETDDGYVTLVNAKQENGKLTEANEHTGIWAWKNLKNNALIKVSGDVRLSDVTFGYLPDKPVLHNVSLYAKPGQKIAFVGATGAGKTTITNLLNRFYDIEDGKISYDGIDINTIKKPDLRRALGIVLQDTHLFSGTVMDNIRYGNLSAADDDCIRAAKLANAHDFISRLPQGYETYIEGTGENLSQGQRQLISIARAEAADPPVMILDEATSSIDTRTEALVSRGMDTLMKNRTVFVIAHRLSTVKNARAIMVLENGRITERGDHNDLIMQKGHYYRLYTGVFTPE